MNTTNMKKKSIFSAITLLCLFGFLGIFRVLRNQDLFALAEGDLRPGVIYEDLMVYSEGGRSSNAQDCPPKWRSVAESYRSTSITELRNITEIIDGLAYNATTSPKHTTVAILDEQPVYQLCDVLVIKIEARDWWNRPKTYGGDFFRWKIYYPDPYSAAAEDEIIDFQNGTYVAFFTLRWSGEVRVQVRLIHPAEVLPQMSLTLTGQVGLNITFEGEFVSGDVSEEVICRYVELPEPMCNLSNPRTHGPWYCQKPKDARLTCKDWRFHKMYKGTFLKLEDNLTPLTKSLLLKSHMVEIKNNLKIAVLDRKNFVSRGDTSASPLVDVPYCSRRGVPQGIHTSGHFFKKQWYPDGCRVVSFNLVDGMKCLRHRNVVFLGDSTIRQVYEYFRYVYGKYFKQLPLGDGVTKTQGPLVMMNEEYNVSMQYHFHGLPSSGTGLVLRTDTIEYIVDRMNSRRDGCGTAYILSLWAHFIATGKEFYVERMMAIRGAIQGYLDRCPESKVIIKGANTKGHPAVWIAIVSSEWNIVQHELALREVFRDEKRVAFLDAFDVTKVQPYTDQVHPERPIIKEFTNRILTQLCKS